MNEWMNKIFIDKLNQTLADIYVQVYSAVKRGIIYKVLFSSQALDITTFTSRLAIKHFC